ncbi:MAG: hypothetical protein QXI10_03680 [Candidatus Diapherotrites archaeon]
MVIESLITSIIGMAKGSFYVSIPVYLLVIIGNFIKNKVQESGIKSWLASSFIATNLVLFVILFLAYFLPVISSLQENEIGIIPSTIAPTPTTILSNFLWGVIKVILATLLLSTILMPLELIGSYIHSKIVTKFPKLNNYIRLYLTSLICSFLGSLIVLFIIPELPTGFFYFLYFA